MQCISWELDGFFLPSGLHKREDVVYYEGTQWMKARRRMGVWRFRMHCVLTVGEPFMAPVEQYVFAEMLGISEHFAAGSHEWLPYSVIQTFSKQIGKH